MNSSSTSANPDRTRWFARSFYLHAVIFTIVNVALLIVNLKKTPGYLWIKWVLLDWGVGLATHAWIVFRTNRARA